MEIFCVPYSYGGHSNNMIIRRRSKQFITKPNFFRCIFKTTKKNLCYSNVASVEDVGNNINNPASLN